MKNAAPMMIKMNTTKPTTEAVIMTVLDGSAEEVDDVELKFKIRLNAKIMRIWLTCLEPVAGYRS